MRKIYLINRPGSVQTVFQIGALGIEHTDPDYAAMAVGDATKTREVLAKFGTVEEYDADGKLVRTAATKQ